MLYDAVIRRGLARATTYATERPARAAHFAALLAVGSRIERRRVFAEDPAAAHPDVVRHLLDQAWTLRTRDTRAAAQLARRALETAIRVARTFSRPAIAADLLAECWAQLANLDRIHGNLRSAEHRWHKVNRALRRGSGDRLLQVEVLRKQAALKRSQRRFEEAIDLLRAALRFQGELEDPQGEGELRTALSIAYQRAGEPEKAYEEILRSLELLDPVRDPELHFFAVRNSVIYLTELGQHEQALLMAGACEVFYAMLDDEVLTMRGRWVKGRLHARCGEPLAAEAYLDRVRRGFREKGLIYESALATLDLALVHAEERDLRKVKQLVEEMYPVFVDKAIPREAAASLILFADSARRHGATAVELNKLIDSLHALRLH